MTEWEKIERVVVDKLSSLESDTKSILSEVGDIRVAFAAHIATDSERDKRINELHKKVEKMNIEVYTEKGNRKVLVAMITAISAIIGSMVALFGGFLSG